MSSQSAPVIADLIGDRVLLRRWTVADIAAVRDGHRRPHWAADFPADGDRVIADLLAENPAWTGEYGHRLIVERASDLVVGSIGLFWPPHDGRVEIGYGTVPSRRGRGYAAESTRLLATFALTDPLVHTVYANVERANPASIRVLEKAGFERSTEEPDGATERWSHTGFRPKACRK
ncbi:GNAT family N-acetyltransferase [Nocardia mexicana]|uniref:RimJ/RimL family protein N-acetyltransferase n=1 Tax=Nocardia mexicana TaxID=279262 RepID=A0A370H0U5_9NOCA|nr:GNAT family N-acetyltransferase [Nocardia mexicana]RDI49630.1 RimJ/RimL family protein N-acetyltransferase [Nocardia mexicana]